MSKLEVVGAAELRPETPRLACWRSASAKTTACT